MILLPLLTQVLFTPFPMSQHNVSSLRPPPPRKNHIGRAQYDFEVGRAHHISTQQPTNRTHKAMTHVDSQSHQAILAIRWKVRVLIALMKMEESGPAAHILTVADLSRT